ncbi:Advillin [Dissostichus eleginoides]|uniref:Advillin n=1 Tax=Dissostichus eleginoides TaxID=100907 RepID=A0AAD9BK12_DISEL|nr:Advillin [Dissostichus eleginoides]
MEPRFGSKNEKPWSKERPSLRQTQHKFSRMMSDDNQDTFKSVSRKPGLQIWTINNMQMVPVQAQGFGNFFEGDCYIVLFMSKGSSQSADIHYWIGNSSSQDEQGAAAIFVTQLDEHLGGGPVQYREVQGNESPRFRSYFKNGLIYKKGGVASGFHHVDTNVYNVLRLLHVKGRKHVTASEVEVSWSSFNNGDIFLLDMGKAIVQWNGPQSNRREKLKAVLLAQDIRDRERGGRAQIGMVEGGDEKDSPELMKVLMAVLGQRAGPLKEALPDDRPDEVQNTSVRLYHVFENSGNLVVQEVATQPLTQDLLHSSDCYILDQRGSSVMVWKGKQASKEERKEALNRAVGYIKAKNYPSSTSVKVMTEGGESAMFKHMFKSWSDRGQTQAKVEQVRFDVMELHARPELAAQQRMVDDGSGDVKVWRIEDLELAEVNPSTYGQFYGGDCYLVLYTYQISNQQHYILYMWQGRHATKDEITASAYQAVDVDNKYNGAPVQVRVVMGKEPRHFLAIFKAKLVIFEDKQVVMEGQEPAEFWVNLGGKAPYASDKRLQKEEPPHSPRLFECSNQIGKFRMTEVEDFAQSDLDEEDVMLLDTWEEIFLWVGNSANQYETKEAWNSAQDYLRTHPAGIRTATFTGWFNAWDPHKWSGGNSYEEMKKKLSDPASLSQITVDLNNTNLNKSAVGGDTGLLEAPPAPLRPTGSTEEICPPDPPPQQPVHPEKLSLRSVMFLAPEVLVNKNPDELPAAVDPELREDYLSDEDFENLLGTTRADFKRLPKWRQSDMKKKAGLF